MMEPLPTAEPDSATDHGARERLGAALRELADAVTTGLASASDIDELADTVEAATARLRERPVRGPHDNPFHPYSLVGGRAHPLAPQLRLDETDGGVVGVVRLGRAYEGGPGLVHGGILALLFDHAMGSAVYLHGQPAMTRALTIHYQAPTPIEADLRVSARVERVDGRRVHVVGEICVGGSVRATADAVFVRLTADNVARLFPHRTGE
jgi:acyl-coenzyme A thioesterase PaaI-like protein